MKMKLTVEEVTNIVVSHMNVKGLPIGSEDVTIEFSIPTPAGANYVESICRVRYEFPIDWSGQTGVNGNKIPAIKRLRELTGIGLAEAKWAVERPDEAIDTWIRYGRYLISSGNRP